MPARLPDWLALETVTTDTFLARMLLPSLQECAPSVLRTYVVVAAAIFGEKEAQLKNLAFPDVLPESDKELPQETLGKQVRLSLNHTSRLGGKNRDPQLACEMLLQRRDSIRDPHAERESRKRRCSDPGANNFLDSDSEELLPEDYDLW